MTSKLFLCTIARCSMYSEFIVQHPQTAVFVNPSGVIKHVVSATFALGSFHPGGRDQRQTTPSQRKRNQHKGRAPLTILDV